jgi:hypothetical protein
MGRSQPTTRNLIEKRREDMDGYRRMFRKQHQEDFDRVFRTGRCDDPSASLRETDGDRSADTPARAGDHCYPIR